MTFFSIDPLFVFAVKRGGKKISSLLYPTSKLPLSAAGEERDGKRSDARVSRIE
jgi:hypothetical protein